VESYLIRGRAYDVRSRVCPWTTPWSVFVRHGMSPNGCKWLCPPMDVAYDCIVIFVGSQSCCSNVLLPLYVSTCLSDTLVLSDIGSARERSIFCESNSVLSLHGSSRLFERKSTLPNIPGPNGNSDTRDTTRSGNSCCSHKPAKPGLQKHVRTPPFVGTELLLPNEME
jgi:hypothetical protein